MRPIRPTSSLPATALIAVAIAAPAVAQPPLPTVQREMRGLWVATVTNIDWPSSRTSSTATKQAQLTAIFDKAAELRMNTIVFQVRPACDALYPSTIEPWSYWLTNSQGTAPSPAWDPLAYSIQLAHARGMELHAWLNPYRAKRGTGYTLAANHIANTNPGIVRDYGTDKWLDPGDPATPEYSLSVVNDIVTRYDVDGIHFDDYFYPYPISGTPFPDDTTYAAYTGSGGQLSLSNWRRKNVDDFVLDVYTSIKASKPWVKFGLSPFGIWRPGNPAGITGLDAYSSLYADSKKWLNNGWIDYFTPQLYWEIDNPGQEYPLLLDWWISQNTQGRLLAPGLFTSSVSFDGGLWDAADIIDQVVMTQGRAGSQGNIHFSSRQFMLNSGAGDKGLNEGLRDGPYAKEALIPAMPWLDDVPPTAPDVTFSRTNSSAPWILNWTPAGSEAATLWVVYYLKSDNTWAYDIVTAPTRSYTLPGTGATAPTYAVVSSIDRVGNESTRPILGLADPTPTPSPSPSPSLSPTATPEPTESPTATPSLTPSLTPTLSPTPSLSPTATPEPTESPTATPSLTPSLTPTLSPTPSLSPTATPEPTESPTATPSLTPSLTPTLSPTPSLTPTLTPSLTPSPTATPSPTPTPVPLPESWVVY
jgi:uncharacterized lipoprotein YddW (UPF0748 family)